MIHLREVVEHNIWWQVKSGKSSFWFDNWTKLGALCFIKLDSNSNEEVKIKSFVIAGAWDRQMLASYLTDSEIVDYICDSISPPNTEEDPDKAWWMGSTSGFFSVMTA